MEDLTPPQGADLIVISNDTGLVDSIFEKIKEGPVQENLDRFLTQLGENEMVGLASCLGKTNNLGSKTKHPKLLHTYQALHLHQRSY